MTGAVGQPESMPFETVPARCSWEKEQPALQDPYSDILLAGIPQTRIAFNNCGMLCPRICGKRCMMKQVYFALVLAVTLCLALSSMVLATQRDGGFFGPGAKSAGSSDKASGGARGSRPALVTVEQARTMADDSRVTLRGFIVRKINGEHYMFRDDTGSIQVEIERRVWNGQNVSPTDLIEVQGEVDRDRNSVEIEIKRLIKLPGVQ